MVEGPPFGLACWPPFWWWQDNILRWGSEHPLICQQPPLPSQSHSNQLHNYTTYDMWHAQDSLNPCTHANMMVLSHKDLDESVNDEHPYWYACIIGVFHAYVRHLRLTSKSENPHKMDLLWVCWFGHDLMHCGGWKAKCLHRIGFLYGNDASAFGFLDPNEVIQAIHIIPAFAYGHISTLLVPSIACQPSKNDEDWLYYYVNMWVLDNFVQPCN